MTGAGEKQEEEHERGADGLAHEKVLRLPLAATASGEAHLGARREEPPVGGGEEEEEPGGAAGAAVTRSSTDETKAKRMSRLAVAPPGARHSLYALGPSSRTCARRRGARAGGGGWVVGRSNRCTGASSLYYVLGDKP